MQQTQQLGFNLTPPGKCTDLPLLPVLPSACLSQHTVRIKVRKVVWYRFHLWACLLTIFSYLSIVNIIVPKIEHLFVYKIDMVELCTFILVSTPFKFLLLER